MKAGTIFVLALAALVLAAATGQAQNASPDAKSDGKPDSGLLLRSIPVGVYEFGTEEVAGAEGNSTFLRAVKSGQVGYLTTWMRAEPFRGRKIRMTTRLKLQNAGQAGCSIGIWIGNKSVSGRNGPRSSGTRDWTTCSAMALVPDDAERVELRFVLMGKGTVWSDGYRVTPAE